MNDFGQEEVGISKRDARRSALRDMYAHSTEAHVVTTTKKRTSSVTTSQKYMPRSFEGGKYDSQSFWGLSSTKAKTAKPLIRVGEAHAFISWLFWADLWPAYMRLFRFVFPSSLDSRVYRFRGSTMSWMHTLQRVNGIYQYSCTLQYIDS